MGFNIDRVTSITSTDATQRVGSEQRVESNRAIYNKNPAEFTLSGSYQQYHAKMVDVLMEHGLPEQHALYLADYGRLHVEHVVRIMIIMQRLQKKTDLVREISEVIRRMVNNGNNLQQGLKAFLDAIEDFIGIDTQSLIAKVKSEKSKIKSDSTVTTSTASTLVSKPTDETTAANPQDHAAADASSMRQMSQLLGATDGNDRHMQDLKALLIAIKQIQTNSNTDLSNETVQRLKYLVKLANHSMEEFPNRFHLDLFGYAKLSDLGVGFDEYLKISHDVSPMRLLTLLIQAQKFGHQPQAMVQSLLTVYNSGGSILDAVRNLEVQYKILMIDRKQNTQRLNAREIEMRQGESVELDFVVVDTTNGILPKDKLGVVVYPQQFWYSGGILNLAFLPVGEYCLLLFGYTTTNDLISRWVKVHVKAREQNQQKSFNEFQKQYGQQSSQQDAPKSNDVEFKEQAGVVLDFAIQPENFRGTFLGEVVMPFDLMNLTAEDLLIISPKTGIVLDGDEFANGCFSNNAVTFRFLANFTKHQDLSYRHGLLDMNPSQIFDMYNLGLMKFVRNPTGEWLSWKKTLEDFFLNLRKLFPDGQLTFEMAEKFFINESENFAKGILSGEVYQNTSLEKAEDRFMAALYTKGSFVLARAGDVSGALQGFCFASLIDIENTGYQANLGDYLEELKKCHYTHEAFSNAGKAYDLHIQHHLTKNYSPSSYFKDLGSRFVKSAALQLPQFTSERKNVHPGQYAYGLYQNR